MRPVNLIPASERRDGNRPLRSGPLPYVVLGALLAALAAVTVLVVTNNQIADSEAEIETLNGQIAAAEARAAESAAFTQFHQISTQRTETVTNLANSRFDWERVIRQLALVIPGNVWLTNMTGTVKPEVSVNGAASVALRDSTQGPALQLEGCATGQDAVADFVARLKEIEGVTRVGMQASELPAPGEGGEETGGGGGDCQTEEFIAKFQIVAAFDAAPIPVSGGEAGEVEVTAPESEEAAEPAPEGES